MAKIKKIEFVHRNMKLFHLYGFSKYTGTIASKNKVFGIDRISMNVRVQV